MMAERSEQGKRGKVMYTYREWVEVKNGTRPLIVFRVRIVLLFGERGFGGSRELPFADRCANEKRR